MQAATRTWRAKADWTYPSEVLGFSDDSKMKVPKYCKHEKNWQLNKQKTIWIAFYHCLRTILGKACTY